MRGLFVALLFILVSTAAMAQTPARPVAPSRFATGSTNQNDLYRFIFGSAARQSQSDVLMQVTAEIMQEP